MEHQIDKFLGGLKRFLLFGVLAHNGFELAHLTIIFVFADQNQLRRKQDVAILAVVRGGALDVAHLADSHEHLDVGIVLHYLKHCFLLIGQIRHWLGFWLLLLLFDLWLDLLVIA